jgi:hypothetical protein
MKSQDIDNDQSETRILGGRTSYLVIDWAVRDLCVHVARELHLCQPGKTVHQAESIGLSVHRAASIGLSVHRAASIDCLYTRLQS